MPDDAVQASIEPEWAAFVAIDWADQKHYWKLVSVTSGHFEQGEFRSTPEAVDSWAAGLAIQFGGRPIAVCLEQSRGALVLQLSKYSHIVLYPVHPTTAARFRQAFYPSGSKSDRGDTNSLLELLLHHRNHLRRLEPDSVETRLLQMLVEQRRSLVNEKTAYSNRLTAWLKMYFPQLLQWMDDIDCPLACDLLERWPTLQQLQRVHPGTLRKFFLEHNCRSQERIQERIDGIYRAVAATGDAAMLEAGPMIVRSLVAIINTIRTVIRELEQRIEQIASTHSERFVFAGLPGAGRALLPRLLAAFGTRRDRFADAEELLAFSGIAPVTEQSGKSKWVHFRWSCPKFLRQTFHEFASHSIRQCCWARAFYDLQRQKGKSHHAAVRSLAFKWIRILYRCWKERTPYDERTYLRALQKHHSPLSTQLQWITVAGFQKLSQRTS